MKHLPYTSYMPSASIQDESAFLPEKGCIRLVRRVLPESGLSDFQIGGCLFYQVIEKL